MCHIRDVAMRLLPLTSMNYKFSDDDNGNHGEDKGKKNGDDDGWERECVQRGQGIETCQRLGRQVSFFYLLYLLSILMLLTECE